MALAAKPSWNPLNFDGTELPVELVLLVKILALAVLLTNHVRILPDRWLPFVPGIDRPPRLRAGILFNRRVRLASLVIGSVMLIAVVSSKAYYGNNETFCGLMFLLTGLYIPGRQPWTLRCQLAISCFALEADADVRR